MFEMSGPGHEEHAGHWEDKEGADHVGLYSKIRLFKMQAAAEAAGNTWDFGLEGPSEEVSMELNGGNLKGQMGGGMPLPKPKMELNLFKAKGGFASRDKDSDHDRGMHLGLKYGRKMKTSDQPGVPQGSGPPVHFGITDADHDGNSEYHFGVDVPIPWIPGLEVSADYETETPGSDLVSSGLLGPMGMPLNFGMHALGLGDYAPGTLLHDAVFGEDNAATAVGQAQAARSMKQLVDTNVKAGMSREDAERLGGVLDPSAKAEASFQDTSETMYKTYVQSGMSPEAAAQIVGAANPGWLQLRQVDAGTEAMHNSLRAAGMSPEAAQSAARNATANSSWPAPANAADHPFAHYAE